MDEIPEEAKALVSRWKSELLEVSSNKKDFLRDDYKELLSLAVIFVEGSVSEVSLQKPGALHKARWMSKLIYALKIVLLKSQISDLPKGMALESIGW